MLQHYRYVLLLIFIQTSGISFSQLQVTNNNNALQLVNAIVGPGYTITNIKLNCPVLASGTFNQNNANLGFVNGILLTTGEAAKAVGPNNSVSAGTNNSTPGDADMDALAGMRTYDACALEFDMEPACDTFRIRYIFASEEYLEFVGSTFNDVFAFLISGPGIPGGKVNLAKVPGTNQNVSVNTINNATNNQYYVNNPNGNPNIQYDGYTKPLEAKIKVSPCNIYHLKLVIADVDDGIFDAGIFIEGNSIQCNPVVYNDIGSNVNGMEGCNTGGFRFCRTGDSTKQHVVYYRIGGTAINGTDYKFLTDSVIIPAGKACQVVNIQPIDDGIYEPVETIKIYYRHGACPVDDSLEIQISDPLPFDAGPNKLLCPGDTTRIGVPAAAGYNYSWAPATGLSDPNVSNPYVSHTNNTGNPITYHYTVSVTSATDCILRDSVTVVVRPSPLASFSVTGVCANTPIIVNEQSQAIGGAGTFISRWHWSLGNNLYDTVKNPSPSYPNPGAYPIKLTVTDNFGCKDDTTRIVDIYPIPKADFSFVTACEGDTVSFTNLSTVSSGTIGSATWNFGDGSPLLVTTANPRHLFPMGAGTYTVQLTVASDQNCLSTTSRILRISTQSISAGPNKSICTGDTTQIGILSAPGYTYTWSPGTGLSNVNISNPSITLINSTTAPVAYHYTLSVRTALNCLLKDSMTVVVRPNPVASFSVTGACVNTPININDLSLPGTGAVLIRWNWNLGNNLYDTVKNPAPVYSASGNFPIQLTVTDNHGCTDDTLINVEIYPLPKANFNFVNACEGDSLSFTSTSSIATGNIVTSTWDFGDGSPPVNGLSPKHLYPPGPGTYTVQLTVTSDNNCTHKITKQVQVYAKPKIDFRAEPVCVNHPAMFFNNSTASTYLWDFGDGTTSTLQDPTHTYTTPGTKNIKLIGVNQFGCTDSLSKTLVINPPPIASFSLTGACTNSPVGLTDLSQAVGAGAVISRWHWNFGNNLYDTIKNPSPIYLSPGVYPITLTVTDNNGCVDDTVISVEVYPLPKADFSIVEACEGDSVTFTNLSSVGSGNIRTSIWSFGDGTPIQGISTPTVKHLYPPGPGNYIVQIIVTSDRNCIHSVSKPVEVHPKPLIDFKADPVCVNGLVRFQNSSTADYYQWFFGDGDSSTLRNAKHIYTTPGSKTIKLIGTNKFGCSDSLSKPLMIYPEPVADFVMLGDSGCAPLCVNFLDRTTITSPDTLASWKWMFNDGLWIGDKNYIHCFNKDDEITPGLIVTSNHGCVDTIIKTTKIKAYPTPTAGFTISPSITSVYDPIVTIKDASGEYKLYWNFGDGSADSLKTLFQHSYPEPGTYTVTQIVVNKWGCRDTIIHTLRVNPETTVFVPNAFTPDDNGINDDFFPKVSGYLLDANFVMYIFDRWGNRVFTSDHLSKHWDGRANGGSTLAQQDVYMYLIIFTDKETDEELRKLIGHVTLVR